MTYTEAVEKALNGDTTGFDFLYNSTKNNKYYLALKYVKNEEAAKDVLQEAYIRAWKNLDKLKEPERFESWLSQIVVNTAKNELEKRNHTPLDLRAESSSEEENDTEIFDRAVSSWDNVPELEYTKEETRQLVHELIDSLSDEQRFVVIAFELEGMTTKEIAEQLGCSEATVKSRLRYGRNNIKEKAEELQKKGYKLYGIAPIALLLYLLREDMVVCAAETSTQLALSECAGSIMKNVQAPGAGAGTAGAQVSGARTVSAEVTGQEAVKAAAEAVKKITFLSTKAGKAVAGLLVTAAVAGTAVGIVSYNNASRYQDEEEEEIEETLEQPEEENGNELLSGLFGEPEPESESQSREETQNYTDEVGWSEAYMKVLKNVVNNTLYPDNAEAGLVGGYGFEKEIYENLTEEQSQFEYALVDLDKDEIPEILIRANTAQSYDGMSYWIMVTYKKSVIDGNYIASPVMARSGRYPVIEGVASAGGSRVYVTMNEEMDEFFIVASSAANGDSHTYRGYIEYESGFDWWREEETGYYTYEQTQELEEAKAAYPVEIEWKPIDASMQTTFKILNLF